VLIVLTVLICQPFAAMAFSKSRNCIRIILLENCILHAVSDQFRQLSACVVPTRKSIKSRPCRRTTVTMKTLLQ
jgi:hypothetical protein